TLNRTELGFDKYFWLSAFGSVAVKLNAGKVWDKVPFPLLILPKTNLSYTIQANSFSLMNPLEFITDEYALWDVTYHMSGWLLNYIPLVKKLKLREVVSFRGMFGNLSKKNMPENNPDLFVFPTATYRMGRMPYMELTAGVTNLLKLFRIEYVWRLSYRDHPNIDKSGVRVGVQLSF
ncbi:MAG: carboxypeptidase-like regulatory domain-containing protein, partial [Bacteroidales bacterium]